MLPARMSPKGPLEEGDTVKISFKGALADGTTADGMSSDEYSLTLGSGSMIDGFEEGLYRSGHRRYGDAGSDIPDPYQNNTDLSGKDVTFEVTVLQQDRGKCSGTHRSVCCREL